MVSAAPGDLPHRTPEMRAHLAACPGCREALARIETSLATLGSALQAARPGMDDDDAVRLALAGAERWKDAEGKARTVTGGGQPAAGRAALAAATVLAASVVLVAVTLWRSAPGGSLPDSALADARGRFEADLERFSIEAPADQRVAVFQTANPDIRVVWFY